MSQHDELELSIEPPEPEPATGTVDPDAAIRYLAQRCKHRKVALFVGAGASAAAGLPLWSAIGEELKRRLKKVNPGVDDTAALASMYVDEQQRRLADRRAAKKKLVDLIQNLLYSAGGHHRPGSFGEIYPRLARLPVANFYSTNWDQILVQCLIRSGRGVVETFDSSTIGYQPGPASGDSRHVVFLHGTVPGAIEQVIVTAEDYFEFDKLARGVFDRLVTQLKSDTTLLCVGYSFGDLNVLEYLRKARTGGHPGSRIYALLPRLSVGDANVLWRNRGILPISFNVSGAGIEPWVCAFLDALLACLDDRPQELTPPVAQPEDEPAEEPGAEIEALFRRMAKRSAIAGLRSPLEWFTHWPGADALRAQSPPTHPLLETVYVEREARCAIVNDLRSGRKAGISGLLGIGGVGKSYLAMKIAHELVDEGWDVAWVALLDQGATEALDQLAGSYGLELLDQLATEEKVAALRHLFDEVARTGRRTLVVLDNAERFPNLPLLLETLISVPVLITSRTEECRDIVGYHRVESMTGDQSIQLCRLYLNEYDEGRFDRLDDRDREDLRKLCDYLGGHPLGIRLLLAGHVRRGPRMRRGPRPFARILDEIRAHGLEAIPRASDPCTGRAGEALHRTVYSTFAWLFSELPEIWPENGLQSQLLLPLIAALGVDGVQLEAIEGAMHHLRAQPVLRPSPATQPDQPSDSTDEPAGEPTAELEGQQASAAGTSEELAGTDKTPPREAKKTGSLASILDPNPPIDLIPQTPQSPDRPTHDQQRPDEPAEALPEWLQALARLNSLEQLEEAIDNLIGVSLVEATDRQRFYRIHPLVREFSFAERAAAGPACDHDPREPDTKDAGLSLEAIFRAAIAVLSHAAEHGETLIDLLPRLGGRTSLAEAGCLRAAEVVGGIMDKLGDWRLARRVLEQALELAESEGLAPVRGRLLCLLGELLDRMELPEGLPMIREGIAILASDEHARGSTYSSWAVAYLANNETQDRGETFVRSTLDRLRALMCAGVPSATLEITQGVLRRHMAEGPMSLQLGCNSGSDNFLTNCVLDLDRWLRHLPRHDSLLDHLSVARKLLDKALERARTEHPAYVHVSAQHRAGAELALLLAEDCVSAYPEDQLDSQAEQVLDRARAAGMRGISRRLDIGRHRWGRALLQKQWPAAARQAEQDLELVREYVYADQELIAARYEIGAIAAMAASEAPDATVLADLDSRLDAIEATVTRHADTETIGWVLLARGLLNANHSYSNPHLAARSLVQARSAFHSHLGAIPREASILLHRAIEIMDQERPVFDNVQERLTAGERRPPDLRPWSIRSPDQLPARVRCTTDGKLMRLVHGGLQAGPEGRESWMYPFYIDESPVTINEYRAWVTTSGGEVMVLGPDSGSATGVPHERAGEYAAWARKRLPIVHEWYAAMWQHAAAHCPEQWVEWPEALRRMFERIEVAIQGRVWDQQPLLPGQDRSSGTTAPDDWLADRRDEILSGRWWRKHPALRKLLAETVQSQVAGPEELTEDEALRLIDLLTTQAVPIDDRLRALAGAAGADRVAFDALVSQLEEEADALRRGEAQAPAYPKFWKNDLLRWALQQPRSERAMEQAMELMGGAWLQGSERLREQFGQKLVSRIAANEAGFSAEDSEALAIGLAGSISLTVEEKKRIVDAVPRLSHDQLSELLKILDEERRKFSAFERKHGPALEGSSVKHNDLIIKWLLEESDQEPVFSTPVDLVDGAWCDRGPGRAGSFLRGDPFTDCIWHRGWIEETSLHGHRRVGIRTVLPVFTASDLELVEPVE